MSQPDRPVLKNVFAGERVSVAPMARPITVPHGHDHDEMQVEVIREGAVVRAIDIVCGCGQRLRLNCQYAE